MTLQELSRLASSGEGPFLEFKKKVPRPERIAKEIIAFANTRGGRLLLGVDDDGSVTGLRDAGEEEFSLHSALGAFCDPPVHFDVFRVEVAHRRDAVVVQVPESATKPHYLVTENGKGPERVPYVRVEDRSIEASVERIELMKTSRAEPVRFEFGENERLLMRYLDEYGRITVSEFAMAANISEVVASETLVTLTRANVLIIHPGKDGDFFTHAYDHLS